LEEVDGGGSQHRLTFEATRRQQFFTGKKRAA
jgi:hypothetical protein